MAERELVVSHEIGVSGRFRLTTVNGTLRLAGTDGTVAEVRARYRVPGGAGAGEDAAEDGVIEVSRGDGELTVAVRDPGGPGRIAALRSLVNAGRPDVHFEVRLPRGAAVRLEGVGSDSEIVGIRGDLDVRTVNGDLRVRDAGGRVSVTTVSGDVSVSGDVLRLSASSTSGDVALEAELLEQLAARSVSGDVSVRAALGRDAAHSFESVSGDLALATPSGLSVEMSALSGSLRSASPTRKEQRGGRRVTVVGDGAASLRVRTVSGDIRIGGPGGVAGTPGASQPFGIGVDLAALGAEMGAMAAGLVRDVTRGEPPAPSTDPGSAGAAEAQLAILRALEAGAIDVDEAARRLEELR